MDIAPEVLGGGGVVAYLTWLFSRLVWHFSQLAKGQQERWAAEAQSRLAEQEHRQAEERHWEREEQMLRQLVGVPSQQDTGPHTPVQGIPMGQQ